MTTKFAEQVVKIWRLKLRVRKHAARTKARGVTDLFNAKNKTDKQALRAFWTAEDKFRRACAALAKV